MQTVAVTFVDGRTVDAQVTPRVEVEFEDEFDVSATQVSRRNKYVYWIAWKALALAGQETRDFMTFVGDLDTIEVKEENEDRGPIRPGSQPGASSS